MKSCHRFQHETQRLFPIKHITAQCFDVVIDTSTHISEQPFLKHQKFSLASKIQRTIRSTVYQSPSHHGRMKFRQMVTDITHQRSRRYID